MRDLVYTFLNNYCKEDIKCVVTNHRQKKYRMVSGETEIMSFSENDSDRVMLFRSRDLCECLGNMFNISNDESSNYIRDWIGDKLSLNKVSDILKFIPETIC